MQMHQITLQSKTISESNPETQAFHLSTLNWPSEELYKYVAIVHMENLDNLIKRLHWIMARKEQMISYKVYVRKLRYTPWWC